MYFLNFFRYLIVLEFVGFGFFFIELLLGEIVEIVSCFFKKLSFLRDKFVGMNIIGFLGLLRKEKRFVF